MMKKIVLVAFALLWSLSSCVSADDVVIGDIKSIKLTDLSNIELTVEVENKSRRNFELRDIELTLFSSARDRGLMKLIGSESVMIPKRSHQDITVPLRFNLADILSLVGSNLNGEEMENFTLHGKMLVKSGMFKERIEFNINVEDHLKDDMGLPDINIGDIGALFE